MPTKSKKGSINSQDDHSFLEAPSYDDHGARSGRSRGNRAVSWMSHGSIKSAASIDQSLDDASAQAYLYQKNGFVTVGLGRLPALLITFIIELLPAFVFSSGEDQLIARLDKDKAKVFIGFIAIVSAISGNVGLQSSSINTRAISHRLVNTSNWKKSYCKEISVAFLLGFALLMISGGVACFWAKSVRVGICIGIAQMISIVFAGISGTASPLIFHMLLGRDPGMWAGPLETAVQDIVGAVSLFYFSLFMLDHILPHHWS